MITFVGLPDRSSGIIRGKQIASHLPGAEFINSSSVMKRDPLNRIVIFIRSIDTQYAQNLQKAGYIVGFDLLDRPVADEHSSGKSIDWLQYSRLPCNFFIVNNAVCRQKFPNDRQVFVIPHHHVGMTSNVRSIPKSIGYIGLPDQFDHSTDVKELCAKNGLEFISANPTTQQGCIDFLNRIDIGCIYVDVRSRTIPVLAYKPNTKLTNFQSFATPTVCCRYESFIEFGENAYSLASSKDELLFLLNELVHNNEKYKLLSETSLEVGKKFQITSIVSLYNAIVESYASS